jgi:hypothetical protein
MAHNIPSTANTTTMQNMAIRILSDKGINFTPSPNINFVFRYIGNKKGHRTSKEALHPISSRLETVKNNCQPENNFVKIITYSHLTVNDYQMIKQRFK